MGADRDVATALARFFQDALRWHDHMALGRADDILMDLDCKMSAEDIIGLARSFSRPQRGILHCHASQADMAGMWLPPCPNGPPASLWPVWRAKGGRLVGCSRYPHTQEHILAIIAYWLTGNRVPWDVELQCRYFGIEGSYSRPTADVGGEAAVEGRWRDLMEECGRRKK